MTTELATSDVEASKEELHVACDGPLTVVRLRLVV